MVSAHNLAYIDGVDDRVQSAHTCQSYVCITSFMAVGSAARSRTLTYSGRQGCFVDSTKLQSSLL